MTANATRDPEAERSPKGIRRENWLGSWMARCPWLGPWIRSKGWYHAVAYLHRTTGLLLVFFICFHVYTLTYLKDAKVYQSYMDFYSTGIFLYLQFFLSFVVIFHALNGMRLILFEFFGFRCDVQMLKWVVGLSGIYVSLIGYFMFLNNQTVDAQFFWICVFVLGLLFVFFLWQEIGQSNHTFFWKLQRLTSFFLFVIVPSHMLFMHLNSHVAHDIFQIKSRLSIGFIQLVVISFIMTSFYHVAYGIAGIINDYLRPGKLNHVLICASTTIFLVFSLMALIAVVRV